MYVQCIQLLQGYTTLDTVIERLSGKAESGQSYDLEEEHKEIHDLLMSEMRKVGYEPRRGRGSTDQRTARGRQCDSRHRKQVQKQVP